MRKRKCLAIKDMKRTIAFSESDLDLVRLSDSMNQAPLLPTAPEYSTQEPSYPWDWTPHRWALRFTLHLAFVSLFETIFFWKFVSIQEDAALIQLINTYTQGIWNTCWNLTEIQQDNLRNFVDVFLNSTTIQDAADQALADRSAFNNNLLRNSWLYVGCITASCLFISIIALIRKLPLRWRYIFFENITFVALLGAYEWMFFSTIVLKYQSISIAELDSQIFSKFQALC